MDDSVGMGNDIRIMEGEDGVVWYMAQDICDAFEINWKSVEGSIKPEWKQCLQLQSGFRKRAIVISKEAVQQLADGDGTPDGKIADFDFGVGES